MAIRLIMYNSYFGESRSHVSELIGVWYVTVYRNQKVLDEEPHYLRKEQVHDDLVSKRHRYYTRGSDNMVAEVEPVGRGPSGYIRSQPDKSKLDNLLKLQNRQPPKAVIVFLRPVKPR